MDAKERKELAKAIRAGKVRVTLQLADPKEGRKDTPIELDMSVAMNRLSLLRSVLNKNIKYEKIFEELPSAPPLLVSSVVIPDSKTTQGVLIKATSLAWSIIVERLSKDWDLAYSIPPDKWEEIVAGAYVNAGFEVVLTPRSGDDGRDVIATTKGIGCIKIVGSVKAYKPGHLVSHEHVREMIGVLAAEPDASKAIITTTSDFAPRIKINPRVAAFLPTRLELVNGGELQKWLSDLAKN
jgi:restriction system protein